MRILPTPVKKYSPQNILNINETGLFFKCVPNKTCFLNNKCRGDKHLKERITVAVATNKDVS